MDKTKKRRIQILAASVFWLGVWQAAAVAIGQEVFLVSPVQAIGTLVELLPQAEFWQRIGFSAGRILLTRSRRAVLARQVYTLDSRMPNRKPFIPNRGSSTITPAMRSTASHRLYRNTAFC